MTKVRLLLLCFYHLGLHIESKEQLDQVAKVIDIAHEIEPFKTGAEVGEFMGELLFPDGVPAELAKMVAKCGAKWHYYFLQGKK